MSFTDENAIATAWYEHRKMKFPVSIQFYHSAPENKDKDVQLGIVYAAGCIQSFITDGRLNQQKRLWLVQSKKEIESCLDIQDEAGRVYLEILNDICAAVLDATVSSDSSDSSEGPKSSEEGHQKPALPAAGSG